MVEYEVGYKKPPKHTQFKKGVCANPKGRGKKAKPDLVGVIDNFKSARLTYRKNGVKKKAPRSELHERQLVKEALEGRLTSIADILGILEHPIPNNDSEPQIIIVRGGLPTRDKEDRDL
jgi:hypothetical protein